MAKLAASLYSDIDSLNVLKGQLKLDEYVTDDELDEELKDYVTKNAKNVQDTILITTYATKADLEKYVLKA